MLNKKQRLIDDYEEIQIEEPVTKGKKILFLLVPIVIAVIAAAVYAVLHFIKNKESSSKTTAEQTTTSLQAEYAFVEIDDIIVTLASASSKKNFLKISLSLQVKNKNVVQVINTKLPIIKDSFQLFLRELRPGDLSGSAGILMLKNELLKRINKIVAPEEVMDVLFKEILLS